MTFVDTSIWVAAHVQTDPHHAVAVQHVATGADLITTDVVVEETLTLLRARGYNHIAVALGTLFFVTRPDIVYFADGDDWRSAWRIFRDYADKSWSFADCMSYAVMERFAISSALSVDHHLSSSGLPRSGPEPAAGQSPLAKRHW